jgi:hypothetical protein
VERLQTSFSFHRIPSTIWSITTEGVTMATLELSARRLILAGGFAIAVAAAPAIAVFAVPSASVPLAQCPGGEEEDTFIGVCVPHTVPNAGAQFSSIPGNPDLPAVNLPGGGGSIPCTGHNSGQCIGLAEESAAMGPQPVPESTVSSSP